MFDLKIGETVNAPNAEVETNAPKDTTANRLALPSQVNRVDFIFCRGFCRGCLQRTGSCVGDSNTH